MDYQDHLQGGKDSDESSRMCVRSLACPFVRVVSAMKGTIGATRQALRSLVTSQALCQDHTVSYCEISMLSKQAYTKS
jgi:hypothetical protein